MHTNSIDEFESNYILGPHMYDGTMCFEWIGLLDRDGYGLFKCDGKLHKAHRWMYEYEVADIGYDMVLDHRCRNRNCVNPKHLEPVTITENVKRGLAGKVNNRAKERGKHGKNKIQSTKGLPDV